MEGEVEIPEILKEFYKIIYTRNVNWQCSARKSHMIERSSAEASFACSGGKLISGKYLSPGLTVKSLTGSLAIVSLLFLFGHCAREETIRWIDLDLEETPFKTETLVIGHIIRKSLEKVTFLQVLHGTILISTSQHHLEQIQYTIHMEFINKCKCNKCKLSKNLPPTHKMRQFQTMEKGKFVASRKHTLQKTLSVS